MTIIITFLSCGSIDDDGKLMVGENGNLKQIVIPDDSGPVITFAASELRDYLREMTGISLMIKLSSDAGNTGKTIRLKKIDDKKIKWDGFSITAYNEGIKLKANKPIGLLFAVYSLLEDAGCSFFYPGEAEEIVPKSSEIVFQKGDRLYNPRLEHRGLAPYGLVGEHVELGRDFIDWMAKNRFNYMLVSEDRPGYWAGTAHATIWKDVAGELLPEVQKRGFTLEMSEHCTHIFFPRSLFKEHPEWFALNDGVRKLGKPPLSGQMCYSNHDAVEYYAREVAKYAAKHPEFKVIGTWPLDGGNYCECEGCKDPLTVFNAAKRVAELVKEVRPDMIVEHLAYKPQTWQPPDEDIPANMSILWCPDNGSMDDLAREWVRKSKHSGGVYQFEYYMGDNYRSRANVWLRPVFSADLVRHAEDIGFRGIISLALPMQNWWRSSFNNWFFAKACWDKNFDVNAALHEYCQKYYGDKAGEVEKVFKKIFTELHPEPYTGPTNEDYLKDSPAIIATAGDMIDQLDRIIESNKNPDVAVRLARLRAYVEFFRLYTEAFAHGQKEDLERLAEYSRANPALKMVLMDPEYIRHRNEDYFK